MKEDYFDNKIRNKIESVDFQFDDNDIEKVYLKILIIMDFLIILYLLFALNKPLADSIFIKVQLMKCVLYKKAGVKEL